MGASTFSATRTEPFKEIFIGEGLFSFLTDRLQFIGNGALLRLVVEYVGLESAGSDDASLLWIFFLWKDCNQDRRIELCSFWKHLFAFTEVLDLPKLAALGFEDLWCDLLCVLTSPKLTLRGPIPHNFKPAVSLRGLAQNSQVLQTVHLTLSHWNLPIEKARIGKYLAAALPKLESLKISHSKEIDMHFWREFLVSPPSPFKSLILDSCDYIIIDSSEGTRIEHKIPLEVYLLNCPVDYFTFECLFYFLPKSMRKFVYRALPRYMSISGLKELENFPDVEEIHMFGVKCFSGCSLSDHPAKKLRVFRTGKCDALCVKHLMPVLKRSSHSLEMLSFDISPPSLRQPPRPLMRPLKFEHVLREMNDRDLELLTQLGLENVRSISLKQQIRLHDASLGPFLKSLGNNMQRIHLMCRKIGPLTTEALSLKSKIQNLVLQEVRKVDVTLAKRFPLTETLNLSYSKFVSSVWLEEVATAGRLSSTRELCLAGIPFRPDSSFVSVLHQMPLLRRLDISYGSTPAGRGFDAGLVKILPFLQEGCTVLMSSKELNEFISPSTKTLFQEKRVSLSMCK